MSVTLTQEQKAKIFAMYLGCKTIQNGNDFDRILVGVGGINDGGYCYGRLKNKASVANVFLNDFHIVLTPLIRITDEDAIEVASFGYTEAVDDKEKAIIGGNFIKYYYLGNGLNNAQSTAAKELEDYQILIFQYLISKGYAVPMFIEPGHLGNGLTPIELLIAIEKQ